MACILLPHGSWSAPLKMYMMSEPSSAVIFKGFPFLWVQCRVLTMASLSDLSSSLLFLTHCFRHCPPCWSLNVPSMLPSQGSCTCHVFSSPRYPHGLPFTSFKSSFRCHLYRQAFPDHPSKIAATSCPLTLVCLLPSFIFLHSMDSYWMWHVFVCVVLSPPTGILASSGRDFVFF